MGSVVGGLGAYWLGAALGRDRVYRLWARIPLSEPRDLERAESWFADHQRRAVFLGRFIPVVRSLISVPAGVAHMRLSTFVLYTALGSGLWNALFILLGYQLGARWRTVGQYSDVLNWVTIVVAVARDRLVGGPPGAAPTARRPHAPLRLMPGRVGPGPRWRGSRRGRRPPGQGRWPRTWP